MGAKTDSEFLADVMRALAEGHTVSLAGMTRDEMVAYFKGHGRRRVLRTRDLSDEYLSALDDVRMDPRHAHLDALMDDE